MQTPWGVSQHESPKAEGIVFYSTARHGGYWLSNERLKVVHNKFPDFTSFAGGRWFEEDCDCVVVALAFPEYYDDSAIYNAVRAARSFAQSDDMTSNWKSVVEVMEKDQDLIARHDRFAQTLTGKCR
jgi:hypothetical protein